MRFLFCILFFSIRVVAQDVYIEGNIINERGEAIEGATISYKKKGTVTDNKGFFRIGLSINKLIILNG